MAEPAEREASFLWILWSTRFGHAFSRRDVQEFTGYSGKEKQKGRNCFLPSHFIGQLPKYYAVFRRIRARPSKPDPRRIILVGSGVGIAVASKSPE